MDNELAESHRRVLGSGMSIVDSSVVRVLDLLDARNSPAAIPPVEGSIPEDEKIEIKRRLLQLQDLIRLLVEKYDLEPSKKNLSRVLAAEVSQIWVILEDCRPGRMRGYGAMAESAADALEADVAKMLKIANWLRSLLSS